MLSSTACRLTVTQCQIFHRATKWSQTVGHETRKCIAYAKVKFDPCRDGVHLLLIQVDKAMSSREHMATDVSVSSIETPFTATRTSAHLRPFDITESGSFDLYVGVALSSGIDDFLADMFAFTITISPYDEHSCILGLVGQILGHRLLVLNSFRSAPTL